MASVIVPCLNGGDALLRYIESVVQQESAGIELILVDNASDDGSIERARALFSKSIVVPHDHNRGFAGARNQGGRKSFGRHLLLLNMSCGGFKVARVG